VLIAGAQHQPAPAGKHDKVENSKPLHLAPMGQPHGHIDMMAALLHPSDLRVG
jgi:hypothetical protein